MNKKITIYIPTKNRLDYLQKAIRSVIEQTYTNWELFVINDASTDDTRAYLDELSAANPKIIAIHNETSQGACVCRNSAIFAAEGEFITGLDDDDEFMPNRLQNFIDNWNEEDKDIIALCSYKNFLIKGKYSEERNPVGMILTADMILYKNLVGNQVFIKTSSLREIGGFDPDFKMWQDYNIWYKILNKGWKIRKLPIATYIWENSPREDRITQKDQKKVKDTYDLFVKKNNLNFKQANLLKFSLVNYGLRKYNWSFLIEMVFGTLFDKKTINIMRTNVVNPSAYKFLKTLRLVK